MPEQGRPKYHLSEQRADALLRPMALTLAELEARAQHFLDRLQMVEEDRAAVAAAHKVIAAAHAELETLWQARVATPRRGGEQNG